MSFKNRLPLITLLVFSFSCSEEPKEVTDLTEKIRPKIEDHFLITDWGDTIPTGVAIPTKGKRIDPDSVAKPKTTRFTGKPKVVPAHSNVHPAGKPQAVPIPKDLTVITPGENGVPLPRKIPAQGKVVPAKHPQAVPASPPAFKDNATANIQYMGLEQGLTHDNVYSLFQDSRGYLWFGGGNGLSRFDGVNFTHFTPREGLVGPGVWSILEDSRGHYWFGTETSGMCRYDGVNFIHFTMDDGLLGNYVWSILEDKKGYIWIGTGIGVFRYDPHDGPEGSFTHFTTKQGLNDNNVRSIFEDSQGNIWFGIEKEYGTGARNPTGIGGVCRYQPDKDGKGVGTFTQFTPKKGGLGVSVRSILEDEHGNLWLGTNKGLSRFDGVNFTQFTTEEGLINNEVWSLEQDLQGKIWLGTTRGVSRLSMDQSGTGGNFTHFTAKEGVTGGIVISLLKDSKGDLWMAMLPGGVNLISSAGFSYYSAQNGLTSDAIRSSLMDRRGNLWMGFLGGSYTIFNSFDKTGSADGASANFIQYRKEEGSLPFTLQMLEDNQENIWITSGDGMYRYDPDDGPEGSMTHFTREVGLSGNNIRSILKDRRGNLWFGTRSNGVSRYTSHEGAGSDTNGTKGTFTHFTTEEGLSGNYVWSIFEDSRGNMWFRTDNGVSKLILHDSEGPDSGRTSGFFIHFSDENSLGARRSAEMMEDRRGNVWFPTNHGVSRYQPDQDGIGTFSHFTQKDGLADDDVMNLLVDSQGNIWAGTANGLSRYLDTENGTGKRFTSYTTKDGLSGNMIRSIIEDTQHNIWVSTLGGISLLVPLPEEARSENNTQTDPYRIYAFNPTNGLKHMDFLRLHTFLDPSNRIWWGGNNGMTMLDLNSFQLPSTPPSQISLNSIELEKTFVDFRRLRDTTYRRSVPFGEDLVSRYDSVPVFTNYPVNLTLPYDLNQVSFHFSAIDWAAPSMLKYSFFLKGADKNWSLPSPETKADYRNLPPGAYTFKVKAIGSAQKWSEVFEYRFRVLPPWYQSWWMKILYAAAGILLIWGYIRRRTVALRNRQKELEQTIRENTQDIRQKNMELVQTLDHLQRTQQQLILQEKMASLGQMTAGVAHELKNPLNFVNNLAELSVEMTQELKEAIEKYQNSKDPEVHQEVLQLMESLQKNAAFIQKNGQRADGVVKSMMDHASDKRGERRLADLNALVKEHIKLAYYGYRIERNNFDIEIQKDLDAGLRPILINPQEIGRVILNLINNACYALEDKAKNADANYKPIIQVSTRLLDTQAQILIRDNGPGIPANIKDQIFNPFFTTKPTGRGSTGLGLSISYDIISRGHQGNLCCQSEEGEFTEFVIALPIAP